MKTQWFTEKEKQSMENEIHGLQCEIRVSEDFIREINYKLRSTENKMEQSDLESSKCYYEQKIRELESKIDRLKN